MADKIYPKGMYFGNPRDAAPSYVKGTLSIKSEDFINFLREHTNESGYANFTFLESKDGKGYYFVLDTYQAEMNKPEEIKSVESSKDEINPDEIPF